MIIIIVISTRGQHVLQRRHLLTELALVLHLTIKIFRLCWGERHNDGSTIINDGKKKKSITIDILRILNQFKW